VDKFLIHFNSLTALRLRRDRISKQGELRVNSGDNSSINADDVTWDLDQKAFIGGGQGADEYGDNIELQYTDDAGMHQINLEIDSPSDCYDEYFRDTGYSNVDMRPESIGGFSKPRRTVNAIATGGEALVTSPLYAKIEQHQHQYQRQQNQREILTTKIDGNSDSPKNSRSSSCRPGKAKELRREAHNNLPSSSYDHRDVVYDADTEDAQ